MKDSFAAPRGQWLKTPFANLVRYVPSGIYFSRIRVLGKLIRRSLKTNKLAVARLRLADLEKVERQRIELQGAIANGNMTFGEGKSDLGKQTYQSSPAMLHGGNREYP